MLFEKVMLSCKLCTELLTSRLHNRINVSLFQGMSVMNGQS